MDNCSVKNAGKAKKTGMPITKKKKSNAGASNKTRQRKKHGPMQAQPAWRPFMA